MGVMARVVLGCELDLVEEVWKVGFWCLLGFVFGKMFIAFLMTRKIYEKYFFSIDKINLNVFFYRLSNSL